MDGAHSPGDGGPGVPAGMLRCEEPSERGLLGPGQRRTAAVKEHAKLPEVAAVGRHRVRGQPSFEAQMGREVGDQPRLGRGKLVLGCHVLISRSGGASLVSAAGEGCKRADLPGLSRRDLAGRQPPLVPSADAAHEAS